VEYEASKIENGDGLGHARSPRFCKQFYIWISLHQITLRLVKV